MTAHRTSSTRRFLRGTLLLALVGLALAACSDGGSSDGAGEGAASTEPTAGVEVATDALAERRTAIDVRTPEEWNLGHVDGATLIDIQAPDFDAKIAELDPEGAYVVYCRSGNRSAQAAIAMREAGLDVTDGGALTDMIDAGWAAS